MKRKPRHVFGPRKGWISVALGLCLSAGALVARADNLLPATSFAEGPAGWTASGNGTRIEVYAARAYGDGVALRIEDHGPQIGQAQSAMIAVDPARRYFVSLRLRLDDDLPARAVIDLQSFTVDRNVRGGARPIGAVEGQSGWISVMRTVKPRDGAAFVRLRVIPAADDPGDHGACWIDEVVLKPVDSVTDEDLGLTWATPAHRRGDTAFTANVRHGVDVPHFGFEDLAGWTVRHGAVHREALEASGDRELPTTARPEEGSGGR